LIGVVADIKQIAFADPVAGSAKMSYSFVGQLRDFGINPRLCGWTTYDNFDKDVHQQKPSLIHPVCAIISLQG
jgi:hypothetical protein